MKFFSDMAIAGLCVAAVFSVSSATAQEFFSANQITPVGPTPFLGTIELTPVNSGGPPLTGIHFSGFMLYPTLKIGGSFNDNVFAESDAPKGDFAFDVHPALDLETTWPHYLVALHAEYDGRRLLTYGTQDLDNYRFGGESKFDLGPATQMDLSSEEAHLSEVPGDPSLPVNASGPVNYDDWHNALDLVQILGRIVVEVNGTFTTLRFENAPALGLGGESQKDRDVITGAADIGYEFATGLAFFGRSNWNRRDYQLATSEFRSSQGSENDAGLRVQLANLISGQAYVGYIEQEYQPPLPNVAALDYGAQLTWSVTNLTTVNIDAYRAVQESEDLTVTAYLSSVASLSLSHSLTQSLSASAGLGYANNEYKGQGRNDNVYSAMVGANYQLNPRWSLSADYRHTSRSSNVSHADYDQDVIETGLNLAL